ncbi:Dps family protein [Paenibacillus thailandensis]|uniref:Dps family protein n=1 Tax=Paenibacillus thailandensis TaxID=393250 RepID=A0ABW5QWW7_9BACL
MATETTAKQTVQQALNLQVANWSVLYTKLHHYHWYVKGSHFYTLHAKFEELYDAAADYVDELAERLLALNGEPASTMREQLNVATIKEAAGGETAEEMVTQLIRDFKQMSKELSAAIEAADSEGDQPSADMFTGIQASVEKHIWMLAAFVG